jgi:transcriptional regulator with XRE-family HTH domain
MRGDQYAQEPIGMPAMDEQERMAYAERVRPARRARGLGQSELAAAAGVARGTISNIESGATVPQSEKLWRVMRALDLTPDLAEGWPEPVQAWLRVIAPLIEAIPAERQGRVLGEVIMMLADAASQQDHINRRTS